MPSREILFADKNACRNCTARDFLCLLFLPWQLLHIQLYLCEVKHLLTAAWAQLICLLHTCRVSQWDRQAGWTVSCQRQREKTEGGLSEPHSSVGEAKHNTVPSSISLCAASVSRCELTQPSLWEPVLKSCSPCEGGHADQSLLLDRPLKGSLRVGIRVRIDIFYWNCTPTALPTQNVAIWYPGNATQQSTVFVVHLGTAQTNPTDSTFKFNGLRMTEIWLFTWSTFHSLNDHLLE